MNPNGGAAMRRLMLLGVAGVLAVMLGAGQVAAVPSLNSTDRDQISGAINSFIGNSATSTPSCWRFTTAKPQGDATRAVVVRPRAGAAQRGECTASKVVLKKYRGRLVVSFTAAGGWAVGTSAPTPTPTPAPTATPPPTTGPFPYSGASARLPEGREVLLTYGELLDIALSGLYPDGYVGSKEGYNTEWGRSTADGSVGGSLQVSVADSLGPGGNAIGKQQRTVTLEAVWWPRELPYVQYETCFGGPTTGARPGVLTNPDGNSCTWVGPPNASDDTEAFYSVRVATNLRISCRFYAKDRGPGKWQPITGAEMIDRCRAVALAQALKLKALGYV
ncbi:MAG: hypothetical protein QG671_2280 [Actinomycetota bacterium]|jgi:hypothetical protein|nr:hypothetical protein [Actinomycetota bacterium]